jgi:multicomponent Na+:H+ antiporter subunit F
MANFFMAAAGVVVVAMALGLLRILYGPAAADRMMAAQLIGSGGAAVLLLLGASTATPAVADVALMLALLAAFASVAFVGNASSFEMENPEAPDGR